jgi:hypothetical protein
VMTAVAVRPSAAAVIVACPFPTANTRPWEETVATDGVLLVHVSVLPVNALPDASRGVAVS